MYSIVPLDVGDLEMDRSQVVFGTMQGVVEAEKLIVYYIEGGSRRILVDTGPHSFEEKEGQWYNFTPLIRARQSKSQKLENALMDTVGITPKDIDLVILTHLHWDHAGQVDKFLNSEIIVSDVELNYAINPLPRAYKGYLALQTGIIPPFVKAIKKIRTVKMKEKKVVEGITVIPTPGHTPGSISVCVETSHGEYVITGDAVNSYENIKGDPKAGIKYHMIGIFSNQIEAWESFEMIDEKVGYDHSKVLPGHDSTVFGKKYY
ncbi:MAG TPA: N-acyl homoserine lactonase family protein [Thermodesulfovibrionales bacterium]|nr:N-acyl homoserine lactonase family protein [Thermodesulfovibrionales bacterium]